MIAHVDMDAFFASVEVRDDPGLRGKPVLVGFPGPRGVVAAASYEARRFGCRSAQPMSQARRRCPDAVVVPPRHDHYVRVSGEVFEIFHRFSPLVEGLSIDEAFIDLGGTERLHGPLVQTAERLRACVRSETGLTCSAGLAAVKFVAKIASDHNKPDGLTLVAPGEEQAFLHPLAVRDLWGVGPKTAEVLEKMGARTIGDIAALGAARMADALGEHGEHLHRLSCGVDERKVQPGRERKQVSHENTYAEDLVGEAALHRALLDQSTRVADRLVRKGLVARKVSIKIRDTTFFTQTRQCTLAAPSDDAKVMYVAAKELLAKLEIAGRRFRLTGVSAAQLAEPAEPAQLTLGLDTDERAREQTRDKGRALQGLVTQVRGRFGNRALFPGETDD